MVASPADTRNSPRPRNITELVTHQHRDWERISCCISPGSSCCPGVPIPQTWSMVLGIVLLPAPACPWGSRDLPSPGDARQRQNQRKVQFQWEAKRQTAFSCSCARV